jgi:YebC/PmpR family DNA-binding regulatory protein
VSGHSKWHNIRVKKSKMDAQKGKAFTKVSKEIYMAARKGGGDPATNFALKNAVGRAREVNMPADNIKRVIEKATGGADGAQFEDIVYEGYGPHGVAVLVEATTDNRNRTAADIRHLFSKAGGALGENGCVGWLFQKRGIIVVPESVASEEQLYEVAAGAGADDLRLVEGYWEIETHPEAYYDVLQALESHKLKPDSESLAMVASTSVSLNAEEARAVLRLLEQLEDLDDIQSVHSNLDLPDDVLEELER